MSPVPSVAQCKTRISRLPTIWKYTTVLLGHPKVQCLSNGHTIVFQKPLNYLRFPLFVAEWPEDCVSWLWWFLVPKLVVQEWVSLHLMSSPNVFLWYLIFIDGNRIIIFMVHFVFEIRWWHRISDAEPSSNFEHKLHCRSITVNALSMNLQTQEISFEELSKCGRTLLWCCVGCSGTSRTDRGGAGGCLLLIRTITPQTQKAKFISSINYLFHRKNVHYCYEHWIKIFQCN